MTLEKLLNKLISLGWKPRDKNCYDICDRDYWSKRHKKWNELYLRNKEWKPLFYFSLNDLCSLDSWLRQFVVENKLFNIIEAQIERLYDDLIEEHAALTRVSYTNESVWYRLMLSSIQQDKAKFLLENIKIPE